MLLYFKLKKQPVNYIHVQALLILLLSGYIFSFDSGVFRRVAGASDTQTVREKNMADSDQWGGCSACTQVKERYRCRTPIRKIDSQNHIFF